MSGLLCDIVVQKPKLASCDNCIVILFEFVFVAFMCMCSCVCVWVRWKKNI